MMLDKLGNTIAPPRFLLFCLVFPLATAALAGPLGIGRAAMVGFDVAALLFLLAMSQLLSQGEADKIRARAKRNDANRTILLAITSATMMVVLIAVANEVKGKNDAVSIALIIGTLVLAWLFSNVVFAVHYAHMYYGDTDRRDGDDQGIKFPDCDEPDYWDFLYFSFTLGMTFQTSDVEIASRRVRRVVLGQSMAAFVFNLGVLAFSINVIGGGK